jgi:uncharacterized CHY-type Zn-finger protein
MQSVSQSTNCLKIYIKCYICHNLTQSYTQSMTIDQTRDARQMACGPCQTGAPSNEMSFILFNFMSLKLYFLAFSLKEGTQ